MSRQHLNTLTIEVIENQRRAAHAWVAALQSGSERAYGLFDELWKDRVVANAPLLSEPLRKRLVSGEAKASNLALKNVQRLAGNVGKGVDTTADAAIQVVHQIERQAERVDGQLAGKALDALSRASLPVAKLSRDLTGRVAANAEKLAGRVAVEPVRKAVRKAATTAKTAARTTKAKVKAVAKPVVARRRTAKRA